MSAPKKAADTQGRILGTCVAPLFPPRGPVRTLIYGEAPGPRGADKSGFPFFGDKSGALLWGALVESGRATLHTTTGARPRAVAEPAELVTFDGSALARLGVVPRLAGVALSNAYPVCPTDDRVSFRAPTRRELASPENLARVAAELAEARRRGLEQVVTLGRTADWLVGTKLGARDDPTLRYATLVHPSPLGLMTLLARRRDGTRMAELRGEWKAELVRLLEGV